MAGMGQALSVSAIDGALRVTPPASDPAAWAHLLTHAGTGAAAAVPTGGALAGAGWAAVALALVAGVGAFAGLVIAPLPASLPIEVLGVRSADAAMLLRVPDGARATALRLRIHGLAPRTGTLAVNDAVALPLDASDAVIAAPGPAFGGVGGACATLTLTVPIPAGTLRDGPNRLRFHFQRGSDPGIGYRVLAIDALAGSTALVPAEAMPVDDPRAWTAPAGASAARGAQLWREAPLTRRNGSPSAAHCGDCHARDGRDLAFYAYSNSAIIAYSESLGLSEHDGADIAAYVRSLRVPAIGRPWDPPFQPGAGESAKPPLARAAGAGVDAALARDADALPLLPRGDALAMIDLRELPIALPLPDWNHWLPRIHPLDAWGDAWGASACARQYAALRERTDTGAIGNADEDRRRWELARYQFLVPRSEGPGIVWDADRVACVASRAWAPPRAGRR
jgi:hypothetical protein